MRNIITVLVCLILTSCVKLAVETGCLLDPAVEEKPIINEAEFNFSITYEYQGNSTEISDVGKCSYVGRACDGRGLHNEWEFTLQSGGDRLRPKPILTDLNLHFPTGGCQALMSGKTDASTFRIAVDPFRGPASEWNPLETQRKIDNLGIKILKYEKDNPLFIKFRNLDNVELIYFVLLKDELWFPVLFEENKITSILTYGKNVEKIRGFVLY